MTKLDALKALAEKVEEGEADASSFGVFASPYSYESLQVRNYAWQAFGGCLDAAKALHESVLPEWSWTFPHSENCRLIHSGFYEQEGSSDSPARAWLLAIIRALIAQEEAA